MVNRNNIVSLEQSKVQTAEREENYFGDSSSVFSSEEASNYPEDQEYVSKVKTTLESRTRQIKRYQVARKPNSWKRKGESKVDKKMRVLKQLIPNCPNVDSVSVLDEAIAYIRNLQNQLLFVLSANAFTAGMYNSRMPTLTIHQLYAAYSSTAWNHPFFSLQSLAGTRLDMPTEISNSSSSSSGYHHHHHHHHHVSHPSEADDED